MNKVICSKCGKEFESNDDYLDHTCEETGFTPRDPQHMGKQFLRQSKAALRRGDSLTKEREAEIDKMIEETDHEI